MLSMAIKKTRQPKFDFTQFLRDIEAELPKLSKSKKLEIEVTDVDKIFFRRQLNAVRQLFWRRGLWGKFKVRSSYWAPARAGEITIVRKPISEKEK